MRPKVTASLVLLGLAALAAAQRTVTVVPPPGSDSVAFAVTGAPDEPPTDPTPATADGVSLLLTGDGARAALWDRKSGNLALRDAKASGDRWAPRKDELRHVAQVRVRAEHGGKPLAAASVELNDGTRTRTALIDPASDGTAEFFAVRPGSLRVTLKAKGAAPVVQIFPLRLDRAEAVPTFRLAVAEPVQTVDATTEPAGTAGESGSKAAEKPNPVGQALVYLVALGIAVGAGFLAMRAMRQNSARVTSTLEQLGVQVPKPGDAPLATPPPPPAPAPPAPVQKIVLDDAAPDPIAPLAPSTAVSAPSLVGDSGEVLPLEPGETVVGRELGLGLSLAGESTVSRRHARLARSGDLVTLTDLGSTNGTFVNGARVTDDVALRPGDAVQFGAVRFRYEA